jgi:hypothetical protein
LPAGRAVLIPPAAARDAPNGFANQVFNSKESAMNDSDAITIEKFDVNFFKVAEQKKQELNRLADGSAPVAEKEKQEIRKFVNEFAAPLEAAAFERGRLAGFAEARGNSGNFEREKTAIAEKAALLVGHGTRTAATRDLSPVGLAKEAKEFVATEEKAGRTVTMAEAMKHVYEQAGVPTR